MQLVDLFAITSKNGLLYHELLHTLFVVPILFILWKKTKNIKLVLTCFLTAYFWDIDHLFDYWGYYGFGFNILKFFDLSYFEGPGLAFVPFHAWELLLVLFYISKKRKDSWFIRGVSWGALSHMVWDTLAIKDFAFYFITYRALVGFRIFM